MARHMVEDERDLVVPDKPRARRLQDGDALDRIEWTELAAEYRLVVRDNGQPPLDVVDEIELAAEVRVPPELAAVVAAQHVRFELEVVTRHEAERRVRSLERLRPRLLCDGGHDTGG